MIPQNFDSAMALVQTHGYLFIFVIMVLEGPLITAAAAFAASFGLFNIWAILLLSLLGDLVGDFLHYSFGRGFRKFLIFKLEKNPSFGKRIKSLERQMKNHFGKAMFAIKFTPFLTTPGLLLAGCLKVDFRKFLLYSFIITLPRTIFFVSAGFYFGASVYHISRYFQLGQYALVFAVLSIILAYFVYKKVEAKFI